MLTRHLDGRETILARGWSEYTPGEAQHWRIEVEGGAIRAFIDGKAVFGTPVEDRTLEAGTIGLYAWASEDIAFDDVVVTLLDNPLNPIIGTSASEFLRGTDLEDLIVSRGGTVDRITAGAGRDTFDFTAIREDSGKNIIRVSDMEAGETIIGIDATTDIVSAVARGSTLHVTLVGDRDQLFLTGITAVDQINWVPADSMI
jgi:Ca2+-binding RTX toxin-like protein